MIASILLTAVLGQVSASDQSPPPVPRRLVRVEPRIRTFSAPAQRLVTEQRTEEYQVAEPRRRLSFQLDAPSPGHLCDLIKEACPKFRIARKPVLRDVPVTEWIETEVYDEPLDEPAPPPIAQAVPRKNPPLPQRALPQPSKASPQRSNLSFGAAPRSEANDRLADVLERIEGKLDRLEQAEEKPEERSTMPAPPPIPGPPVEPAKAVERESEAGE